MKIVVDPLVMVKLENYVNQTHGKEFSGFGFVELDPGHQAFHVYDAVVLDVGSEGLTEIPSRKILGLMQRPDARQMKLWFHRHPLGRGIPGPDNWSSIDDDTCRNKPFGGVPDMVKWSISMVRTPYGWVGRYDTYGPNGATVHIPVEPCFALEAALNIEKIKEEKPRRERFQSEAFDAESDWLEEDELWDGLEDDDEEENVGGPKFFGHSLFGGV
jgi:hypothetical protein